ncbi:MAG TPA: MCP four helix bundle domain-containing protein [Alphaproteobacteria bacterium]|jgi:hypothetical protein
MSFAASLRSAAQLRIRAKVHAGFFLVLALLIAVSAIGLIGVRQLSQAFEGYAKQAAETVDIFDIQNDMTVLQRNAMQFMVVGGADREKLTREEIEHLLQQMTESSESASDPTSRTKLAQLRDDLKSYSASFEKAVVARTAREKLVTENINPLGEKAQKEIEDFIKQSMAANAQQEVAYATVIQGDLLTARLNVVNFLSKPDNDLADRIGDLFEKFSDGVEDAIRHVNDPKRVDLLNGAARDVEAYRDAFSEAVVRAMDLDALVNRTMAGAAGNI